MDNRFDPYVPFVLREWPAVAKHIRVAGTLVHMDLSGFTRLSEKFTRRGREGTENLTLILNEVFGALIDRSLAFGGDLLKFGGDALLLLFQGEDHAMRAAAASVGMRDELRRVSRRHGARLTMTVGMHAGRFELFLAGSHHLELLVLGEGTSAAIRVEEAAAPGEILTSVDTAAVLTPNLLGNRRAEGVSLLRAPSVEFVPERAPGPQNMERYVPGELRHHLGTESSDGEHRVASVAFVRFAGVDHALANNSAGSVAAEIDETVAAIQEAAHANGVAFLYVDSDINAGKALLVAGAPEAHPDDEERLLAALQEITSKSLPFELKCGASRGRLFAVDIGSRHRRAYTVMGDTVNLAARLMSAAAPRQILASEPAVAHSGRKVSLAQLEPIQVKGMQEPVRPFVVGGPAAVEDGSGTAADDTLFVGREQQIGLLKQWVDAARRGDGVRIQVTGEPGVGKTRTVLELLSSIDGMPSYFIRLDERSGRVAYHPFRALLRQVLGVPNREVLAEDWLLERLKDSNPELLPWAPLIGDVIDIEVATTPETAAIAPRFRRERLERAVLDLLADALPEPTVMVFDDTQYMDEASMALLTALVHATERRPWCVIVLGRAFNPQQCGELFIEQLVLEPLDRDSSATILRSSLSELLLPHQFDSLIERCLGNPFFLREMSAIVTSATSDELPDRIEAAVAARIDTMRPHGRRLMRIAAALGMSFREELFDRICASVLPDAPGATPLLDPAFFESQATGVARFRHRLLQEVAYEGLPFALRKAVHKRATELLEAEDFLVDDRLEQLAFHADRAGDHSRAWRYGVAAANRARDRYAPVEAADFYGLAFRHARGIADVGESERRAMLESWADCCDVSARFEEANRALAEALRCAKDSGGVRARLIRKRAMLHEKAGRYPVALRLLTRAARELAPTEPEAAAEFAEIAVARAGLLYRQGKYRDAAAMAQRGVEAAQSAGRRDVEAHALYIESTARFNVGASVPEGVSSALNIYRQLDDPVGIANALNNLGFQAYFRGELHEAIAYWQESMEARDRAGDIVGKATQQNNIGEALCDLGKLPEAESMFRQALTVWRGARYSIGTALATSNLGWTASRGGQYSEARELLEDALRRFDEIGSQDYVGQTLVRLTENDLAGGDVAGAERRLVESERLLSRSAPALAPTIEELRSRVAEAQATPATGS